MTYIYTITQSGQSVDISGTNEGELREKAYRIARKSLDTAPGDVTIHRRRGPDKARLVATLTQRDRVASGERWG